MPQHADRTELHGLLIHLARVELEKTGVEASEQEAERLAHGWLLDYQASRRADYLGAIAEAAKDQFALGARKEVLERLDLDGEISDCGVCGGRLITRADSRVYLTEECELICQTCYGLAVRLQERHEVA